MSHVRPRSRSRKNAVVSMCWRVSQTPQISVDLPVAKGPLGNTGPLLLALGLHGDISEGPAHAEANNCPVHSARLCLHLPIRLECPTRQMLRIVGRGLRSHGLLPSQRLGRVRPGGENPWPNSRVSSPWPPPSFFFDFATAGARSAIMQELSWRNHPNCHHPGGLALSRELPSSTAVSASEIPSSTPLRPSWPQAAALPFAAAFGPNTTTPRTPRARCRDAVPPEHQRGRRLGDQMARRTQSYILPRRSDRA